METTHFTFKEVFSVTKQLLWSRIWNIKLLNGQCYPQHFELISTTKNWLNNLLADMIIEKGQSFPSGSVEHKYWWLNFIISTMSYLWPFYISLNVSIMTVIILTFYVNVDFLSKFQLFVIISIYVIIISTACHNFYFYVIISAFHFIIYTFVT